MGPLVPRLARAGTLSIAFACTPASAGAADASAAETLFRRGRASAEAGDYARACVAFAESQRLEPTPGALLNLADCEERTGRLAAAWDDFVRLERMVAARDERKALARARAASLATRVPRLAVTLVAKTPPGARVFRDDVELDAEHRGQAAPVDPGPHRVLVVAPGHEAKAVTVTVAERETARVVASAGPALPSPAVAALRMPPPPAPAARASSHTAAWIAGGAGVASLGVAAFFGARALGERSASDTVCAGGTCSGAAGLAAYESAHNDARVADVALGVGVVGLAVAACLWLTTRTESPRAAGLQVTASGLGGTW